MKQDNKIIFHFFGLLLMFNGGFMLLASLLSFLYKDGVTQPFIFFWNFDITHWIFTDDFNKKSFQRND